MNILLIFFALPIAVIIISIALQKILKNPILVAAIIFAIFLIVTFIVNNLNFLIAAIIYAIVSFITAFITCIIARFLRRCERESLCCCRRNDECSCGNNNNNVLTIRSIENNTSNCGFHVNNDIRSYQITNADGTSTRINIIPNSCNNNTNTADDSANECGCRRRRG